MIQARRIREIQVKIAFRSYLFEDSAEAEKEKSCSASLTLTPHARPKEDEKAKQQDAARHMEC